MHTKFQLSHSHAEVLLQVPLPSGAEHLSPTALPKICSRGEAPAAAAMERIKLIAVKDFMVFNLLALSATRSLCSLGSCFWVKESKMNE